MPFLIMSRTGAMPPPRAASELGVCDTVLPAAAMRSRSLFIGWIVWARIHRSSSTPMRSRNSRSVRPISVTNFR
jgi:hypothetical protein